MLVYGLRLLVALVTFAAGLAASWLLGSASPGRIDRRAETTRAVLVGMEAAPRAAEPSHCSKGIVEMDEGEWVEGGILNGRAQRLPAPVYPPAAREAGVRGSVYVRVVVDEDGRVSSARPAGGPKMLEQAAVNAALLAVFPPTRLSGRPVRVGGVITYNFSGR